MSDTPAVDRGDESTEGAPCPFCGDRHEVSVTCTQPYQRAAEAARQSWIGPGGTFDSRWLDVAHAAVNAYQATPTELGRAREAVIEAAREVKISHDAAVRGQRSIRRDELEAIIRALARLDTTTAATEEGR